MWQQFHVLMFIMEVYLTKVSTLSFDIFQKWNLISLFPFKFNLAFVWEKGLDEDNPSGYGLNTAFAFHQHIHVAEPNLHLHTGVWTFAIYVLTSFYLINANEIPGELLHKNMISSQLKRSLLLWLHSKSDLSHWKWNGLVFHWCICNKQNITWPLGGTGCLFLCWNIFENS